jgi:hypothetical protein
VRGLLPDYMTMGANGMGDMGEMGMAVPKNSLPMVGSRGPYGPITMGGMFTILKVRDGIASYDDPGWYAPPSPPAGPAEPDELRRDGISPAMTEAPQPADRTTSCNPRRGWRLGRGIPEPRERAMVSASTSGRPVGRDASFALAACACYRAASPVDVGPARPHPRREDGGGRADAGHLRGRSALFAGYVYVSRGAAAARSCHRCR